MQSAFSNDKSRIARNAIARYDLAKEIPTWRKKNTISACFAVRSSKPILTALAQSAAQDLII